MENKIQISKEAVDSVRKAAQKSGMTTEEFISDFEEISPEYVTELRKILRGETAGGQEATDRRLSV